MQQILSSKKMLILSLIAVIVLLGLGYWAYIANTSTETYRLSLGSKKNLVSIKYPVKYKGTVSSNANLPDQKMALFSIPKVINFQLSNEARDKDINTFVEELKKTATTVKDEEGNESLSIDTNYKTTKYGRNKVYFINEYNTSPNFVSGDIFFGKGNRLNFTYHPEEVKIKEVKSIISSINF